MSSHINQIRGLVDNLYEILNEITEECLDPTCTRHVELKRELTVMMHETEAVALAARKYRKGLFGV